MNEKTLFRNRLRLEKLAKDRDSARKAIRNSSPRKFPQNSDFFFQPEHEDPKSIFANPQNIQKTPPNDRKVVIFPTHKNNLGFQNLKTCNPQKPTETRPSPDPLHPKPTLKNPAQAQLVYMTGTSGKKVSYHCFFEDEIGVDPIWQQQLIRKKKDDDDYQSDDEVIKYAIKMCLKETKQGIKKEKLHQQSYLDWDSQESFLRLDEEFESEASQSQPDCGQLHDKENGSRIDFEKKSLSQDLKRESKRIPENIMNHEKIGKISLDSKISPKQINQIQRKTEFKRKIQGRYDDETQISKNNDLNQQSQKNNEIIQKKFERVTPLSEIVEKNLKKNNNPPNQSKLYQFDLKELDVFNQNSEITDEIPSFEGVPFKNARVQSNFGFQKSQLPKIALQKYQNLRNNISNNLEKENPKIKPKFHEENQNSKEKDSILENNNKKIKKSEEHDKNSNPNNIFKISKKSFKIEKPSFQNHKFQIFKSGKHIENANSKISFAIKKPNTKNQNNTPPKKSPKISKNLAKKFPEETNQNEAESSQPNLISEQNQNRQEFEKREIKIGDTSNPNYNLNFQSLRSVAENRANGFFMNELFQGSPSEILFLTPHNTEMSTRENSEQERDSKTKKMKYRNNFKKRKN